MHKECTSLDVLNSCLVNMSIYVQKKIMQRFALMALEVCVTLRAMKVTQKKLHIKIRGCTHTINESSWRLAEDGFVCNHRPF